MMPFAQNFHPEWGYLAPAPSFLRTVRIVLVATAIGATAGAGAVLALMDRPVAEARGKPSQPASQMAELASEPASAPGAAIGAAGSASGSGPSVVAPSITEAPAAAAAAALDELNAAPAPPATRTADRPADRTADKMDALSRDDAVATQRAIEPAPAPVAPPVATADLAKEGAAKEDAAKEKVKAKKRRKVAHYRHGAPDPYGSRDGWNDRHYTTAYRQW